MLEREISVIFNGNFVFNFTSITALQLATVTLFAFINFMTELRQRILKYDASDVWFYSPILIVVPVWYHITYIVISTVRTYERTYVFIEWCFPWFLTKLCLDPKRCWIIHSFVLLSVNQWCWISQDLLLLITIVPQISWTTAPLPILNDVYDGGWEIPTGCVEY